MPNSDDGNQIVTLGDLRKVTEHLDGSVNLYVQTDEGTYRALNVRVELSRDDEGDVRVVVG